MNIESSICIIGAGMSGILAAERLRRLGHHHIEIIEAGAQLGGYTESMEVDGKVYDFQAHLLAQQDFGKDMTGTALQELLDRYPTEVHDEALYFVSRSRSGKVRMSLPPGFVPLFKSMQPEQVIDQLFQAWSLIERASRERTGPGLPGLAFDRIPGETWESFRARHPPLVGAILQSMMLYANMRRIGQPAETVINTNMHLSGHVSQMAKAGLAAYPDHREAMLARMPASLRAQIDSDRPIARSFPALVRGAGVNAARTPASIALHAGTISGDLRRIRDRLSSSRSRGRRRTSPHAIPVSLKSTSASAPLGCREGSSVCSTLR